MTDLANSPNSNGIRVCSSQKQLDVCGVGSTEDRSIQAKYEGFSNLTFMLPIETFSEANGLLSKTRFSKNGKAKPEHWAEKSKRHKQQKGVVYAFLNPHRSKFKLPCKVTLIRMGGHFLDADDNLRISLKWIKDATAEVLTQDFVPGRADSDLRIKWDYGQEKSKDKRVKIIIEF